MNESNKKRKCDDVDFKADTMQDEQEFEHPLIKELEVLMGKVKEKFIIQREGNVSECMQQKSNISRKHHSIM